MSRSLKLLTLSLSLTLMAPVAVPLQGAEETPRIAARQRPVVTAPAVAPALGSANSPHDGCPACRGEVSPVGPSRCRCRENPSRLAPVPTGAPGGPPFGAANRSLFGSQVANGHAAQLVLYQYDFFPGGTALNAAGRRKLERLSPLLVQTPFPLIIEPAVNSPNLDQARRRSVVEHLAEFPFPVPDERVIVAWPPSRGITGTEGLGLHVKFLEMMTGSGVTSEPPGIPAP